MIALINLPIKALIFVCGMVSPINNTPLETINDDCSTSIVYNMEVDVAESTSNKLSNLKGKLEICVNAEGTCNWQIQARKKHQQKIENLKYSNEIFNEINAIIQLSLANNRGRLKNHFNYLEKNNIIVKVNESTNISLHKKSLSGLEIITLFDIKTKRVIGTSFIYEDDIVAKLLCIYDYKGNIISPSRLHINIMGQNKTDLDIDVKLNNERVESH